MFTLSYTHRPADLPGAEPNRDRVVLCDSLTIGRVFEIDSGPNAGHWRWSGYWIGHDNAGVAESMAAALDEIKARVTVEAIEDVRSRSKSG